MLPAEESVLTTVEEDDLYKDSGKIRNKYYKRELERLQEELVKLQMCGSKSRDSGESCSSTAAKGGTIHQITRRTSSRVVKVVALGNPTERKQSQWYFQRCVERLPAAGEMVLFDRAGTAVRPSSAS